MPAFVLTHLGFVWPDGDIVFADLDLTFPTGSPAWSAATAKASRPCCES
jgi:hypothetical protein